MAELTYEMTKQKSLLIAIDFDDTFTADPDLFSRMIRIAVNRGHRVICVTSRRDSEENSNDIMNLFEKYQILKTQIIFCNMGSKLWTMEQLKFKVDIWIDDAPHSIVHGR